VIAFTGAVEASASAADRKYFFSAAARWSRRMPPPVSGVGPIAPRPNVDDCSPTLAICAALQPCGHGEIGATEANGRWGHRLP